MDSIDDDFGELYADVEIQATSAIRSDLGFSIDATKAENNEVNDVVAEDDDGGVDDDDDDEEDDDFDVVVNDDDFDARNGGGGATGNEFNQGGSSLVRVENGEMEQSGCGYGGERATLGLGNVSNMQYKYIRQYGSAFTSNQKSATVGGDDREDVRYIQHGKSNLGRVRPSYAGYAPGLGESGNGFWLPWYRTILDVDIDTFVQKPWTFPGADVTDYFNFGFDEESWKRYCWLVGQQRQQTFQNQFNENSRTKLENEAAGRDNIKAEVNGHERTTLVSESSNGQFNRQVGRPILVEDSNAERLPSMSARGSRYRDSDVVIEIILQGSECSSNVGEDNSDEKTKTQCKISQEGCGFENDGPKVGKRADSKHCEMGMELEENISSPGASSELNRSCESATVSSHMLQASSSQGKTGNLESDTLESGEGTVISKEHARAVHAPNTSMKDADRSSTETNPCVADIDLSYSDHIQSSPTPSDSDDHSKASFGGHHHDFKRTEIGRSSSDSVMDERQVLEDNHYLSRKNQRDAFRIKSTGGKYHTRARSPIEEDRKLFRRRIHKHSELDSYSVEDDNCLVNVEGHFCRRKQLKDHHHRDIKRPHGTFGDDDWPRCGEKKSSLGYHNDFFVERQFQGSRRRETHHHVPWKSKDERDHHFPREWDEEFFWERKMRQMYESVEDEWYLHERECLAGDELELHMKRHSSSNHSSLVDGERWNSGSGYYDFPKHHLSLEYSHSDTPPLDRYARSYPLNDQEEEYLYSDYEYDRRLEHFEKEVARSDRMDQYLENPSIDLDYPQCTRIGDERSNWPRSPHDYHDRHPSYAERRHDFTVERYGVDGSMVHKYRRCDWYISPWKRRDDRWQFFDCKDAYGGQDNVRYHEDAHFFEKMPSVARSKGMNSVEEDQSSKCFNDSYSEGMHDAFKGTARHKWHGVKGGFGRGGMSMHAQSMKHKQGFAKCGDGKSCDVSSPLSTRVELKRSASWCRDSMVARHVVREGKNLQFTGKCTKDGHDGKRDALSTADRSVQKQQKWQPQVDYSATSAMGNITFDVQTFQKKKLPAMKQELASDLREGQIPTKVPHSEIHDGKKSGHLAHNENRILETIAKMEKRKERFKEPILVKKDTGSDPKPDDTMTVTTEPKQQRPARKRRWGGN